MTLELAESPDEPKPWVARYWRHYQMYDVKFVEREDAIYEGTVLIETDCWFEGIFSPDGTLDEEATRRVKGY